MSCCLLATAACENDDALHLSDSQLPGWVVDSGLQIHGAVGTAVGGCTTLVGEPQNLVIAKRLEWDFVTFVSAIKTVL